MYFNRVSLDFPLPLDGTSARIINKDGGVIYTLYIMELFEWACNINKELKFIDSNENIMDAISTLNVNPTWTFILVGLCPLLKFEIIITWFPLKINLTHQQLPKLAEVIRQQSHVYEIHEFSEVPEFAKSYDTLTLLRDLCLQVFYRINFRKKKGLEFHLDDCDKSYLDIDKLFEKDCNFENFDFIIFLLFIFCFNFYIILIMVLFFSIKHFFKMELARCTHSLCWSFHDFR